MIALKAAPYFFVTVLLGQDAVPLVLLGGNASSESYESELVLSNLSDAPVEINAEIVASDGSALSAVIDRRGAPGSRFRWSIRPRSVMKFALSGSEGPVRTGWIRLQSNIPGAVSVVTSVRRMSNSGHAGSLLTLTAAQTSLTRSGTFVYGSSVYASDVMVLLNPHDTENALIRFAWTGRDGTRKSLPAHGVPARHQLLVLPRQLLEQANVPVSDGFLQYQSDRNILANSVHVSGTEWRVTPSTPGPVERFGFENPSAEKFWDTRNSTCEISQHQVFSGRFALRCSVDLDCSDKGSKEDKTEAEISFDIRQHPTSSPIGLQDLEGHPISARVYTTVGARGPETKPNGVILFAKDDSLEYRGIYGAFTQPIEEGWLHISVTPARSQPFLGYLSDGFNPNSLSLLGVKIACGGGKENFSSTTFKGSVYIDSIAW